MIRTKVISVGDEILIGQIVNTNSAFLGQRFFAAGMPVERTVVISDNESAMLDEFSNSVKEFDITVITGGLGPTHDDITKPALVKFFGDELVTDQKVLGHVKKFFAERKIEMPAVNEGQALVPKNSEVIWNNNGTAPGIWIESGGRVFVALPGVPYEMKPMIDEQVIPKLKKKFSSKTGKVFLQKTILTTGIGESSLFEKFGDIEELLGGCKMAFLPSATGVRLRINAEAENEQMASEMIESVKNRIILHAGDYVFGEGEETLELVTGRLLRERNATLSLAESCTGGRISSKVVSVAGSSDYYLGGVCSYSNDAKVKILGVQYSTLEKHGAVSIQTAIEMAAGARKLFGSDYALSTTGIAGPAGATANKPVGLVCIGFSSADKEYALEFSFGNRRDINIERASQRSLEILRRELLKIKIIF